MIVLDASAALDVLLRTARAEPLEALLFGGRPLSAPHLLDLEVAQVLRRQVGIGGLGARRAEEALADFQALPIERYPHYPFLGRIWALRENVTAYDAAYLALTEALDAELVTTDRKLADVPGHGARVRVVA